MALTFSVEHERGGSVLLVVADGPRPDNWLGQTGALITPEIVAAAVRKAIASGWQAVGSGPLFELPFSAQT